MLRFADGSPERSDTLASMAGDDVAAALLAFPNRWTSLQEVPRWQFWLLAAPIALLAVSFVLLPTALFGWTSAGLFLAFVILCLTKCRAAYQAILRSLHGRSAPDREALLALAQTWQQKRFVRCLFEFLACANAGEFVGYWLRRDGTLKDLDESDLRAFGSDYGYGLVVTEDEAWHAHAGYGHAIRGRLFLEINKRRAGYAISAQTLIGLSDARFKRAHSWIVAMMRDHKVNDAALTTGLCCIKTFRLPKVKSAGRGQVIAEAQRLGKGHPASHSYLTKMHAGLYEEFEVALQRLPLDRLARHLSANS